MWGFKQQPSWYQLLLLVICWLADFPPLDKYFCPEESPCTVDPCTVDPCTVNDNEDRAQLMKMK